MTIERGLRLAAGVVVLLSVALGAMVHPAWLLLTAFAGLNLLQSAFEQLVPDGLGPGPARAGALHGGNGGRCAETHQSYGRLGMNRGTMLSVWMRRAGRAAVFLGFAAGVVVLLLWLGGQFSPKVQSGAAAAQSSTAKIDGQVIPVELKTWPLSESAVGTIRAVHETSIGSKLLARVLEVDLKAGQKVAAGEVLMRLDDTELRARLEQAKAAVGSCSATLAQAENDAKRDAGLVGSGAVSLQELERARTAVRSAEAELLRAQENVNEVRAMLDGATIRSPIDAVVIDKRVDVGDMVTPGQLLVTLFDPKRMQLVASVRESLTRQLRVGQDICVQVEGHETECTGTVSEIVPEAQSASRAFQVKVTGPCPAGVYSGMFGRIKIPLQGRTSAGHSRPRGAQRRSTATGRGARRRPRRPAVDPRRTGQRRRRGSALRAPRRRAGRGALQRGGTPRRHGVHGEDEEVRSGQYEMRSAK